MSSSLDEEAGLLFGVTADNLLCFITGHDHDHDHLDLKLKLDHHHSTPSSTLPSSPKLLRSLVEHLSVIPLSCRNHGACLGETAKKQKRRKEQLKSVRTWVNESEAGGARHLGLCNLHYNIQPLTSLLKPDCGDLSIPAPRLQLYFLSTGRAYNPMHLQLTESLC